jgi:hypothetical protein
MMRPFQLAAIRAFRMGFRLERMVRAAHIALRRRGFSFWNRHDEILLDQSGGDARTRKRAAEVPESRPNRNPFSGTLELPQHREGALRRLSRRVLRLAELNPGLAGIGIQ